MEKKKLTFPGLKCIFFIIVTYLSVYFTRFYLSDLVARRRELSLERRRERKERKNERKKERKKEIKKERERKKKKK